MDREQVVKLTEGKTDLPILEAPGGMNNGILIAQEIMNMYAPEQRWLSTIRVQGLYMDHQFINQFRITIENLFALFPRYSITKVKSYLQ